ncbi:hypothetical protein [Saccharopolyspora sp. NPDC049357]|uniref:hypothetical protein n=1 Tax=Saccharopolyspora sp. NPDC049357 TaxID=3154507 RepID=UPI003428C92A
MISPRAPLYRRGTRAQRIPTAHRTATPCFADGDGSIYVSNSELPLGTGGVSALRFDAAATVTGAYPILSGTTLNCSGGGHRASRARRLAEMTLVSASWSSSSSESSTPRVSTIS